MALIGDILVKTWSAYSSAVDAALKLAMELLTPRGPLPRSAVSTLLRRALRNGAWRLLTREQRALLAAASRAPIRIYRAPRLIEALRRIWLTVELATARGRAVVAALAESAVRGISATTLLIKKGLDWIITWGIQVLNNPLLRLSEATGWLIGNA